MFDEHRALLFEDVFSLLLGSAGKGIASFHAFDEPWDAGICEAVEHMLSALFPLHDMSLFQDVQMLADGGKLLIGPGDEITDTELPSLQIFCNPESCRMTECLEDFGEGCQFFRFTVCMVSPFIIL